MWLVYMLLTLLYCDYEPGSNVCSTLNQKRRVYSVSKFVFLLFIITITLTFTTTIVIVIIDHFHHYSLPVYSLSQLTENFCIYSDNLSITVPL